MKKLLALLMACATMTCAFASCGKEDEEGSVSEKSSVSETNETEATTEEATEEETTEEETTEAETEEDTTDADAEDNDETASVEKTTYEYIEDADQTPFLGKWECEKLVLEGEEMTDLMGIPLYAVFQLEIKEDNTAIMAEAVAEISDSEAAVTYTWGVVSDTEIAIVNEDGDSMLFTLDGNYLVGTEEGYDEQLYLAKVDEFTPFDFESFMSDFQLDGMDSDSETAEDEASGDVESETSEDAETPSAE